VIKESLEELLGNKIVSALEESALPPEKKCLKDLVKKIIEEKALGLEKKMRLIGEALGCTIIIRGVWWIRKSKITIICDRGKVSVHEQIPFSSDIKNAEMEMDARDAMDLLTFSLLREQIGAAEEAEEPIEVKIV
jgi:predicted enzyme involved in methoxymalonyl-ACP biosynthesis